MDDMDFANWLWTTICDRSNITYNYKPTIDWELLEQEENCLSVHARALREKRQRKEKERCQKKP